MSVYNAEFWKIINCVFLLHHHNVFEIFFFHCLLSQEKEFHVASMHMLQVIDPTYHFHLEMDEPLKIPKKDHEPPELDLSSKIASVQVYNDQLFFSNVDFTSEKCK